MNNQSSASSQNLAFVSIILSSLFLCFSSNLSTAAEVILVTPGNGHKCVSYLKKEGDTRQYCSTELLENEVPENAPQAKDEKWNLVFDKRNWTIGWSQETDDVTINEYILEGEKIDNWTELITTQYFPNLKNISAEAFVKKGFIPGLKEFKPEISFFSAENPEQELFWEFKIKDNPLNEQDEIQRVVSTENGLYIIHYVIKEADMGKPLREEWINNLKQASL